MQNAEFPMAFRTDSLAHRCKWLTLAIAGLWLVAVLPARHFFGIAGIEAASVSAISCLLGGCLTFWFVSRLTQPQMQAFAVLLGTGIRGIFALVAALVMQFSLELPHENYLIWLGLFYLVSLALETVLMVTPTTGIRSRS